MAFCVECGKKIEDGMKFCPNCGASVSGTGSGRAGNSTDTGAVNQKYKVRFVRPSKYAGCAMALRVRIDDGASVYELKNGKALDVELSSGIHTIEVSMTAVLKKTHASITVNSDRILTCRVNLKGTMSNGTLAGPAIIEDEQGNKISD